MADLEYIPEGEIQFQFRIHHIFFPTIKMKRVHSKYDKNVPYELVIEISFRTEGPKKYSMKVRVRSAEREDLQLDTEIVAVGIFEYSGDDEPTSTLIADYVSNNLLIAINSRLIQLVGTLTNHMGIPAIWLPVPMAYAFDATLLDKLITGDDSQTSENIGNKQNS